MILLYGQVRKAPAREEALEKLRRFVEGEEPGLALFLARDMGDLAQAVTYRELIDLVLAGKLTEPVLAKWRQMYAVVVSQRLSPAWTAAAQAAGAETESLFPGFRFDPWHSALAQWGQRHAAELVTNSTAEMRQGIRAALQAGGWGKNLGTDELARVIRPVIGLHKPQVRANQNYYKNLVENGMPPAKAQEKALLYAARQHRYRAHMVARTELAFGYNEAEDQAVRQAQAAGYMGEAVKEWCTADTERTCPCCSALDGLQVGMDEVFPYAGSTGKRGPVDKPPAHPHCMCGVLYQEVGRSERMVG